MTTSGKDAQGAWRSIVDARIVGAASGSPSSPRDTNFILSAVVDDDGTLRLVTA